MRVDVDAGIVALPLFGYGKGQLEGARGPIIQQLVRGMLDFALCDDLAVPGLAVSDLAVPGLAVSGLAVSGLAVPGLAVSGLAVPGLAVPGLAVSGLTADSLVCLLLLFRVRRILLREVARSESGVWQQRQRHAHQQYDRQKKLDFFLSPSHVPKPRSFHILGLDELQNTICVL